MSYWNAVIEIWIPHDTKEEALAYRNDDAWVEQLYEIFGDTATISGRVMEMSEDE